MNTPYLSTRLGIVTLVSSCGLAVAAGPLTGPEPERVADSKIREFEFLALSGPVQTGEALPMPANRARLSRVTVHDGGQRFDGQVWGLDVIDGRRDTTIELRDGGRSAIELSFIGAPRWLSRLAVDTDADLVSVEYLDLHRKWRAFGFGPGGQTIEGELVKAMGIRVIPVSSARADGVVEIREIDAWLEQMDPDDGVVYGLGSAAVAEYFYEWCETYASSPLSVCSEECEGLRDILRARGWSTKGFGNNSSWEEDFKRSALGGTENSYVDANDLCYFAGHGSAAYDSFWDRTARDLLFSRTDRDDSAHVPGDSYDSWGDLDMEWMCFAACQLMKDDGYWAASMDGQHLIMGWHTNMRDVTMGIDFGNRATSTSIFDPARRVLDSWLWAAEKNHGSGYTAKVVGETTAMGNDYLWGEGYVNPDPVDDSYYTLWTYDTSAGGLLDPDTKQGTGDRTDGLERVPEAESPEEMIRVMGKGPRAVEVLIPERLMRQNRAQVLMKVHEFMPPVVNADYVAGIANQLCQTMGLFCKPDIGPTEDRSEYIATEGPWELRVNAHNGAYELVDTSSFEVPVFKPPQLMSPGQAAEVAMSELGNAGLLPKDAQLIGVDSFMQGEGLEANEGGPIPLEPVHHRVLFGRNVDGYNVAGPPGEMVAFIGENGFIQAQQNSWMAPRAIGEVTAASIEEIIAALSQDPTRVAISGIPMVPERIEVLDVELGYFASEIPLPEGGVRSFLRPAYKMMCDVTERVDKGVDPQRSILEVNAWADFGTPIAVIEGDTSGCVEYGQTLCFNAIVQGGEPPFTYSWSDEVSGVVGTGDKVCFQVAQVSDPADDGGDGGVLAPSEKVTDEQTRSVELTVTDYFGTVTTAMVTIPICQAPDCPADLNGDGILDNGDIGTFIQFFLGGNLAADMNGDGILDNGDIGTFIQLFLAGC